MVRIPIRLSRAGDQLFACYLRALAEKDFEAYRDAGDTLFGLTNTERLPIWQAEWDRRTLLRPAAPGPVSSADLLRASEG